MDCVSCVCVRVYVCVYFECISRDVGSQFWLVAELQFQILGQFVQELEGVQVVVTSHAVDGGNEGLDLTVFFFVFFYCSLQVSNTHWKVRGTGGDSLWQPFDADGQIFGHESSLNGLDADGLQGFREDSQLRVFVELRSVEETACPGEDGGCSWHRFYQLFALGI